MRWHVLFSMALWLFGLPVLFGQVTFEAYTDARQVFRDGFVDVTFSLKNGRGTGFEAPPFEGFDLVAGPRRSTSTTIVNGQVSSETNFSYTLQPRRLGTLTIGSARVTVDGQVLRSEPLSVEVIERKRAESGEATDPYFVRALPSVDSAYLGQQISLDYKLFTTTNIESYNVLEEADYAGFYAQDLKRFDGRVMRELIGGEQYTTKVLKRVALFPQQTGALNIDPMRLQLGIVTENPGSQGSFFFNRKVNRVPASTPPVTLHIRSLPGGAPPGFNGAVGRFSMSSRLTRTQLTTDEVTALRVTITGSGDIKRVPPPEIAFPPSFERYEPNVVEETSFEINGRINSRKTFEYVAQPTEPGAFTLRPRFAYFDPDSAAYRVLGEDSYDITVTPGEATASAPRPELLEPVERDIRYLKTPETLSRGPGTFFGSTPFWALSALPFVLLAGLLLAQRIQKRREGQDPALRRRRRAERQARERLRQAGAHLEARDARAFYDEVSRALLGYISDKVQIPRSDLSKDNVRGKLEAMGVDAGLAGRFIGLLQTCEMAVYAGGRQEEGLEDHFKEASDLLTRIEQSMA